jgi:RimJ/RimL family protein N-acetyltransferase
VNVEFRPLAEADLPVLHRWLNDPAVVRWWEGDDVSWEAVVKDYGTPPTNTMEHWIAAVDGRDVGWFDCYATVDEPGEAEPWWASGIDRTAAGIDYLIGEAADRGRGLGVVLIEAFVAQVVFGRHPDWSQACAAPHVGNVASWRSLEKAGFRFVAVVPDDHGGGRLMVHDRPEPPIP